MNRSDITQILSQIEDGEDVLLVDEALIKLALESPEKAELVKLRYFAGMTVAEAAEAMGISRATADRYWSYARAFLYCEMEDIKSSENSL